MKIKLRLSIPRSVPSYSQGRRIADTGKVGETGWGGGGCVCVCGGGGGGVGKEGCTERCALTSG